jgi:hypothetical protein
MKKMGKRKRIKSLPELVVTTRVVTTEEILLGVRSYSTTTTTCTTEEWWCKEKTLLKKDRDNGFKPDIALLRQYWATTQEKEKIITTSQKWEEFKKAHKKGL